MSNYDVSIIISRLTTNKNVDSIKGCHVIRDKLSLLTTVGVGKLTSRKEEGGLKKCNLWPECRAAKL